MVLSEIVAEESFADSKEGFSKRELKAQSPAPDQEEPAVQVRSDFRSTILWKPSVKTGRDGKATVKIKFASDAYFAFLRLYPEAGEFARLGNAVTFFFHERYVQIGPEEDEGLDEAKLRALF